MSFPEQWIKNATEAVAECQAFPMVAPESAALPYVVYGRNSTDRGLSLVAIPGAPIPPAAQFQVEIYAATYLSAKTLANTIRSALHNFTGTASGVTICSSLLTDERDGDPVFFDGQDKPTFSVEQTYQIRWEE
jgi:hypothetical protein